MSGFKSMMLMPNIQETASTIMNVKAPSAGACVLLRAEGLKKSFSGQVVLDGIDLELRQGEVVLLRGENGSGKTTLLNILTGNLEPDAGVIHYSADNTPRTYYFPRRWWQDLNPFDHFTPEFVAREGVGRTWQDVRLFGSQTLRHNIAVATPGHPGENPLCAMFAPGISAKMERKINKDVETILSQLGLSGREDSSADKISLGQSKRVAIARAVAAGAKILFLDEPLAGLDRQGITDVLTLLENLVRDHDVTLVIIEHIFNQVYLQDLVNADWLLSGGRLQRNGTKQKTSANKNKINQPGPQRPDWFQLLAGDDAEIIDEPLPHGALLTRIRRHDYFEEPAKLVLEIDGLIVKRGTRVVIGQNEEGFENGFDLTIYGGEICLLQAPNGWGKSTLLETITGIIKQNGGRIILDGLPLNDLSVWDRVRRGVIALPANQNLFPTLKARETFQLAGFPNNTERINFSEQICASLSGGQKQKVALITTSRTKKRLTLFDEPFSMLDFASVTDSIHHLLPKNGEGSLILVPSTVHY